VTDDESLSAVQSRAPSALAGGYGPRSPAELSGEHRLMLAILEDAVALYVKSLSSEGIVARREAHAARVWLKSRDCSWPFAFESICDLLGFNSSFIRRGLQIVRTRPAEAAARFAGRHHGRSPGPATPPRTAPAMAARVPV
jgi:hypothetical protein